MSKYTKEELEKLILEDNMSYEEIGRIYEMTGSGIKKAAKRFGIPLPQRRKVNKIETFGKGIKRSEKRYCQNCGELLLTYQEKFCNHQCQADFDYKTYIKNWKAGLENGQKGKDSLSRYIVKYIKEKYNNCCMICGWNQVNEFTNLIPLHIHHINGDALDNNESNLELLCPNCHSLTENYGGGNKTSTRSTLKDLREATKLLNKNQ